ncbi:MBL fold metallo-hydrolase [Clostridium rectalis]|uniref:MBL fold metallo-hydrolase n=1 Tax=Clostridium rectalis TaxID=2040295 RepID=UPI000F62FA89|nr:MBL fold metallo-hydrolase [Clostridium rectalis]
MNKFKAKIHYLYHDGFAVETKNHFLIFDYYNNTPKNDKRSLENGVIDFEELKDKKNILVFSSHHHHDHFNPLILDWVKYNPNIKYILSSDITVPIYKPNYNIVFENKELRIDDVLIKTYGSTDIGVSYLVFVDGISIFHAGDLNWWHWKDDPMEEQVSSELNFKKEIHKIMDEQVDIAFFPVDARLEEFYYIGGKYFIEKVKPNLFIPMHYWDNTYITKKFHDKIEKTSTNIVEISCRGQLIYF